MKRNWYTPKTDSHQGLIIDEQTGNSVAVAFDKADAPLIAAAPDLLEALGAYLAAHDNAACTGRLSALLDEGFSLDLMFAAREAIRKATETE